jgi:methionyl-tRNA formyltransferase
MDNIRIVFMGSPQFGIPSLTLLHKDYQVVGVVTQPDRPSGRGRIITQPPVKSYAETQDIPFIQPERLKDPLIFNTLKKWNPDAIVVAAYGQILPPAILDLPTYGCINVHASLLPRWRGAAPIAAAILNGDEHTGITIMVMDTGLDTGPILAQKPIRIKENDTTGILSERLSILGAELLIAILPHYINGSLEPKKQSEECVTYAPMIRKADGHLDFSRNVINLANQVRAFNPWPGTYCIWKGQRLIIIEAKPLERNYAKDQTYGQTTIIDNQPAVICNGGILVFKQVQPASKKPMPGTSFLQGAKDWGSSILV